MKPLFNSSLEVSMRILLLLSSAKRRYSTERIVAMDFIATYGKEFGISKFNLHGNNEFKFSEYAFKRKIVTVSLKELVLKGHINFHCMNEGFLYSVSPTGKALCESLNDEYADLYLSAMNDAVEKFSTYSDGQLAKFIAQLAVKGLKGDQS